MTMNKKEQAAYQAAMDERDMARALRWPEYTEPEPVEVSRHRSEPFVGWWYNPHTAEVEQGCSDGICHSYRSTTKTNSQGAGRFYGSEAEAAMALRLDLTEKYARKLMEIDRRIAAAETR